MPIQEELEFLLAEAQKNRRRAVELSFKTTGGTRVLTMTVQCDISTGEPLWTLATGTPTGSQMVWTYTSSDLMLIHDLVNSEFNSAAADEELAQSEADLAASSPSSPQAISGPTTQARPDRPVATASDCDNSVIQSFLGSVCQRETGLFPYPAFLYFVDQEYRRFCLGGLPFSIAIFKMRFRDANGQIVGHELSPEAIRAAALRFAGCKRDIDLLAHYGPFDFGLLLPHADSNASEILVSSYEYALSTGPLLPAVNTNRLATCFGVATMPADAGSPQLLIAAALESLKAAAGGPANIVLYKNVRSR